MIRTAALLLVGFAALLFASTADAVTINFDSLPDMSQVGSAFQSEGIIFDAPGFQVRDDTFSAIVIPSAPNYVHLST
jgi:hypothetical protein